MYQNDFCIYFFCELRCIFQCIILNTLSSGIVNNSGGKLTSINLVPLNSALNPGVTQFLNNNRPYDNNKPKAYLNWILFDEQFNFVASNSGVQQVQSGSSKQALVAPLQTITKNGYLYVYVSNESPQDVYFDDLTVKHFTGPLLQEQSFYPFGLQMAGISSKALNKLTSQHKFNGGVELEEDFGINFYNTFYRQYDPQLGRFNGIDILSESNYSYSPFQFGLNNPISFNDPLGDKEDRPAEKDQEDFTDFWETGFNNLWFGGQYGGSWSGGSSSSSYSFFHSDAEAFMKGDFLMTYYDQWKGPSDLVSFEAAKTRYYQLGGKDPAIASLNHVIIVKGCIRNNQWVTTSSQADIDAQLSANGFILNGKNPLYSNIGIGLGAFSAANDAKSFIIQSHIAQSRGLSITKINSISTIRSLGVSGAQYMKAVKNIGAAATFAGGALTVADGFVNGFRPHHAADLGVQAAIYGISASVPVVGWSIGLMYFVGDLYFQKTHNGKSITEYYLD